MRRRGASGGWRLVGVRRVAAGGWRLSRLLSRTTHLTAAPWPLTRQKKEDGESNVPFAFGAILPKERRLTVSRRPGGCGDSILAVGRCQTMRKSVTGKDRQRFGHPPDLSHYLPVLSQIKCGSPVGKNNRNSECNSVKRALGHETSLWKMRLHYFQ